ncbi:MAG: hypothetical protein N2484_05580 [Clostridia bacterium]|nr:hypothetical protein [Clostridia bacterium]
MSDENINISGRMLAANEIYKLEGLMEFKTTSTVRLMEMHAAASDSRLKTIIERNIAVNREHAHALKDLLFRSGLLSYYHTTVSTDGTTVI